VAWQGALHELEADQEQMEEEVVRRRAHAEVLLQLSNRRLKTAGGARGGSRAGGGGGDRPIEKRGGSPPHPAHPRPAQPPWGPPLLGLVPSLALETGSRSAVDTASLSACVA
jgi:hypothetical protein